ncbi:unnamed protein product [Hyaloperonospora brassicae]|uniref:EF-hand domain-containing protein n=1 Tax=Hyaloperonospora brassicae TaxID=162125 RepID=A0AAV0UE10_HYABA|nr:unnamed protein product [Hyaloperonospora brassicae]
MMDVNGHEEISAVALEAEVEKLREIANMMDVNGHEEISAVALQAEVEKLREIASLHDDGHEEISAVALQAKEEKRQEIASLHDDGHDEISDAISQVVKDATFYAAKPVRGRSEIPFGSLDLAILERDIKRLSPNPNSPHLLLKALTSYFKDDVAKLASFFADVSCNPFNMAVIRRMREHVYQDWIAKRTTIKEAASLLKISLQEKDLLASKNYDTWLRYIAARAKNCYDRPELFDLILSELTDLIGKRKTAIVFANGRSKNVEVFKVLESKMFAQWKTGGYSPDSFEVGYQASRKSRIYFRSFR